MADRLVLEIEVADFNVEGIQEAADEFCEGDVLFIVTEELMRPDVALGLVSLPGEKCLNSDFEVHAKNGRIVGARIQRDDLAGPSRSPEEGS